MRKRTGWLSVMGLTGFMLLVSHQNCAPSNMSGANAASGGVSTSPTSREPLPVTIIDDSKSQANLAFPYGELHITEKTGDLPIDGSCSKTQDGATFGWQLKALNEDGSLGEPVASGASTCSSGAFKVDLSSTGELGCGQRYRVVAQLGFGHPAETTLTKSCE